MYVEQYWCGIAVIPAAASNLNLSAFHLEFLSTRAQHCQSSKTNSPREGTLCAPCSALFAFATFCLLGGATPPLVLFFFFLHFHIFLWLFSFSGSTWELRFCPFLSLRVCCLPLITSKFSDWLEFKLPHQQYWLLPLISSLWWTMARVLTNARSESEWTIPVIFQKLS